MSERSVTRDHTVDHTHADVIISQRAHSGSRCDGVAMPGDVYSGADAYIPQRPERDGHHDGSASRRDVCRIVATAIGR